MRGRLFVRYWMVVSALVTGLLLVGGGAEMIFAYRENLARIETIQKAEVRLVAGRIGQSLADLRRQVEDTANLPWHPSYLGMEDARQEFHRLLNVAPPIYEVRGYGPTGAVVLRVSRVQPDVVVDPAAAAAPGQAVPGAPGYQPIHYRNSSDPFTTLVVQVPGPNNLFHVVEAVVNLRFASEVIRETSSGSTHNAYLLDPKDQVVAHTDPLIPPRRLSFGSLPHVSALRTAARPATEVVSGGSSDISGAEVWASAMPIGNSGWIAFVEEPRDRVMADAFNTARRTGFMVLAGLLAALLAGGLLARRMSRPILELRRGAQRIAEGDLAARINVKTGDEVEALAREFNRMAAQLQDYTSGLERKVDEKTAALQEALRLATAAMRARSLFLAAASHDLRQPLYAISILSDALAGLGLSPECANVVEKQRKAIAVLRSLFDNLLDLSRLEAGEVRAQVRAVSLGDLLAPSISEGQALCEAKGLAWEARIEPAWVKTDMELVGRVLANLVSNAVRYTAKGSVRLSARVGEGRVVVSATDTGVGIAAEDRQRVFQEFVQLDNAARDRERGVGLGLSIVKKISDLLGLALELESQPGEGSTFRFYLPLAEAPSQSSGVFPSPGENISRPAGMRVWIVEDDVMVRDALEVQLDAWGVDHDFAINREQLLTLRAADGAWPDAVILDDMLGSGEQGLDLALWLAGEMDSGRIVLTTGNVEPARLDQLAASGLRVLRKPLSSGQLAACLQEALEGGLQKSAGAMHRVPDNKRRSDK